MNMQTMGADHGDGSCGLQQNSLYDKIFWGD